MRVAVREAAPSERPSGLRPSFAFLLKATSIVGYFWLWFFIYDKINQHVSDPVRTIHLTSPRQLYPGLIQPYSALIYVFGGLTLPALPFLYYRSWREIRFVLCCYTMTSLLAFTCYLVWPLSIERPDYQGANLGERLMLWVFSKDLPGNCFPSSHTYFAILAAVFIGTGTTTRVTRISTWALAAAVCVTTVTSGQHYFMDVPGGVAASLPGVLCYGQAAGGAMDLNGDGSLPRPSISTIESHRKREMPGCAVHLELARRVLVAWEARPDDAPFPIGHPASRCTFLFGSLGPDLGYFPGGDALLADLAHCVARAHLTRNLIDSAETDLERALAWGWVTHVLGDIWIHPLINQAVGERVCGHRLPGLTYADDPLTHVRIELGTDAMLPAKFGWPAPCIGLVCRQPSIDG